MIENEKQYQISKKTVAELADAIANMKSDTRRHPLSIKLSIVSLKSFKNDIEKEIAEYEKLNAAHH